MEVLNKQNQFELVTPSLKLTKPLEGKRLLIDRLMKCLGRSFWQVNGVVKDWSTEMLTDSLSHCEQYNSIKAKNWHFNQYVSDTKK